jgi:hypothetical protein
MTPTGGGSAMRSADAADSAAGHAPAGHSWRSEAARLRTVLTLARTEATLLARSVLVLAGLLAGAAVVWLVVGKTEPLWWNVGWMIGFGQLVLGMAVLVAAQLAAGRARRDGMAHLYASFPTTPGTRTLSQLAGLLGAVPAGLVLIGATAVAVQVLGGAIGTPGAAVLGGGLLLVIASGAAGIAMGVRFSHPLAGALGALALFASSGTTHLPWAAGLWLYPWATLSADLTGLPGRVAGYPPAGAHALELAGLAALAGVVALAVTAGRGRVRGGLATAGVVAMAAICLAGALQLRPIPTAELNHLVSDVADPASVQDCSTASQVSYCLYPGFGPLLPALEAPVSGVLAHVPARPDHPLTVRQVAGLSSLDSTLTHGHSKLQVSQWEARLQRAPNNAYAAPPSAIYQQVGSWPAAGGALADAQFNLALGAAEWAVGLPGKGGYYSKGYEVYVACVPLDQAREAVAIWLAIIATHPRASELTAGLNATAWSYPNSGAGNISPPGGGVQTTAAGYLLGDAMTRLPEQKVVGILSSEWVRWLSPRTTDAQLAAALGIPMPSVPAQPAGPAPGPGLRIGQATGPQIRVCTS